MKHGDEDLSGGAWEEWELSRELQPNGAAWKSPHVDYSPEIKADRQPGKRRTSENRPFIPPRCDTRRPAFHADESITKWCALCHHPYHANRCKRCPCPDKPNV